jgi:hypothetical protein
VRGQLYVAYDYRLTKGRGVITTQEEPDVRENIKARPES